MNHDLTRYTAAGVRDTMRPGDVIAFAGTRPISRLIGIFAGSNLSHVGMVKTVSEDGMFRVMITQSTIDHGESGAQSTYLSDMLLTYPGRAWWCPLSEEVRALIDWPKFRAFIAASEGHVTYDTPGLFGFLARGLPIVGPRICQSENAKAMFCSGYDSAILEAAGVLRGINTSQVSPRQLLAMDLYVAGKQPVQLIGEAGSFSPYNSL